MSRIVRSAVAIALLVTLMSSASPAQAGTSATMAYARVPLEGTNGCTVDMSVYGNGQVRPGWVAEADLRCPYAIGLGWGVSASINVTTVGCGAGVSNYPWPDDHQFRAWCDSGINVSPEVADAARIEVWADIGFVLSPMPAGCEALPDGSSRCMYTALVAVGPGIVTATPGGLLRTCFVPGATTPEPGSAPIGQRCFDPVRAVSRAI